MIIPYDQLSRESLLGIIKSFVLQEGTDYGNHEFSLDQKIDLVLKQLAIGKAFIAFNEEDQSATIVSENQAKGL